MKYTNKAGLPETFKRALIKINEEYTGKNREKNISVTTLIDDPHIRNLRNKHRDEIETEVADSLWMLVGSAFHLIMEKGVGADDIIEERIFEERNGGQSMVVLTSWIQRIKPFGIISLLLLTLTFIKLTILNGKNN